MTSEHTGDPTERFFSKNNYFGLDRKNVHFFEQNTMPCVDMDGKILLATKSSIAKAPGMSRTCFISQSLSITIVVSATFLVAPLAHCCEEARLK